MKKIISIMCTFLFCVLSPLELMAADISDNSTVVPSEMPAYLTDEAGVTMETVGRLVTVSSISLDDGLHATYAYELYSARGNNSLTVDDTDGSAAATIYLTVHYTTSSTTPTQYRLNKVSGYWTIHDSNVTVPSATLEYGFAGHFPKVASGSWSGAVSNNFSKTTGFTDYIISDGGTMGATLLVNFKMGTSRTWSFTLYNYIFGQH